MTLKMNKPDTIEDLKNDFEETEKLMEEDKKKYLEHLKKQSADMNEFFQKEDSKTYYIKALAKLEEEQMNSIVKESKHEETNPMIAPILPKENKSILKKLWNNFKKIV